MLTTNSFIDYSLTPDRLFGATTISALAEQVDPGNTIGSALDVGELNSSFTFTDRVSPTDKIDVLQFSLASSGSLTVNLTGLSADADIYLVRDFNGDGIVNSNDVLGDSENLENNSETIELNNLDSGEYFIFVIQYEGTTTYNLTLNTTNPNFDQVSAFSSLYGFGLVDAAAAVALAAGSSQPFANVPDRTSTVASNFGDLNLINVPEVWERGITGEGIVVAVLDSGVDIFHPDLNSNIWINSGEIARNGVDDDGNGFVDDVNGWDFGDRDNSPTPGTERGFDHGTHVAGTVAARLDGIDVDSRGNRVEVQGVAPDATIMPVRVLGGRFGNTSNSLALGIRYAVDNGADIINLSLGAPNNSTAIRDAFRYAEARGVVIISAAGNDASRGATVPTFPARDAALTDLGIAVGAVDREMNIASFSNPAGSTLGEFPYFVAPGVRVLSTVPSNRFGTLSGTSMATPHVAGVVALMLEANPNLTPEQVENILIATSNNPGITV